MQPVPGAPAIIGWATRMLRLVGRVTNSSSPSSQAGSRRVCRRTLTRVANGESPSASLVLAAVLEELHQGSTRWPSIREDALAGARELVPLWDLWHRILDCTTQAMQPGAADQRERLAELLEPLRTGPNPTSTQLRSVRVKCATYFVEQTSAADPGLRALLVAVLPRVMGPVLPDIAVRVAAYLALLGDEALPAQAGDPLFLNQIGFGSGARSPRNTALAAYLKSLGVRGRSFENRGRTSISRRALQDLLNGKRRPHERTVEDLATNIAALCGESAQTIRLRISFACLVDELRDLARGHPGASDLERAEQGERIALLRDLEARIREYWVALGAPPFSDDRTLRTLLADGSRAPAFLVIERSLAPLRLERRAAELGRALVALCALVSAEP